MFELHIQAAHQVFVTVQIYFQIGPQITEGIKSGLMAFPLYSILDVPLLITDC